MRLAQGQIWFVVAGRATVLIDMLHDSNSEKSQQVMNAMLQMKKVEIKTLK